MKDRKTEIAKELDLSVHYRPIALRAVLAAHTVCADTPWTDREVPQRQTRMVNARLEADRD
ncbi:hypothetical protein [Agrobacterium tumefaciens]|uniref:hypothetical protein n=1 Tax=Rhizobium/Agrobacterium group TaxID=227290 RepID=UPI0015739F2D|nr:hypothetical protein [Agrobacterium tumefaciens]